MKKNTTFLIIGCVLFISGVVIGLVFSGMYLWASLEGMAFWGYPESISYDSSLTTEARISRLKCPTLITDGEVGTITLRISNITDQTTRAWIKAHISRPGRLENMVRRTRNTYLSPGDETEMVWLVTTDNTLYNRMVLMRVFLKLTEFHPPARTQHCGIISANLWGMTSNQILGLIIGSNVIFTATGTFMIWHSRRDLSQKERKGRYIPAIIGSLTILSTLSTLTNYWEIIVLAFIIIPILVFSSTQLLLEQNNGVYN